MKTYVFFLLMSFTAISFAQSSDGLNIGDEVPEFTATADDGSTWESSDHIGEKYVVVYFYPAAMTGGCTAQACAYRDFKSQIESEDAMVVGVSGDNVEGLQLFKQANDLNFTLLSDEHGEIAGIFGVPTRDGGTFTTEIDGISHDLVRGTTASRWTFIIDKNGEVVYKNQDVSASSDPEAVLSFLRNNS